MSTRMGGKQDKAFLQIAGTTLLDRVLAVARDVASEVRIVGQAEKFETYAPVVEDVFEQRGPLGGIHAALRSSSTDLNLMLAVDVPFVTAEFLRYLISRASQTEAVVTVPRSGYFHPLCAIYRRSFADVAEQALQQGHNKIDALFAIVPTLVIEQDEMERLGFSPEMLRNLNTPQDFEHAAGL